MSSDHAADTRPLRVFLSHASEDKKSVRRLASYLRAAGIDVWLDEDNLLPGQDWHSEIIAAVRDSDAIIICISRHTTTKEGYVQREVRLALDLAEEKPEGTIFVIPARLDETAVPASLRRWQWVDLFANSDAERAKLLRALACRAEGLPFASLPAIPTISNASDARTIKYYYYVSRTKLEMLGSQMQTPMPGSSISDTVDAVRSLTDSLSSKGLVERLGSARTVDSGRLYLATAEWHHGLFYIATTHAEWPNVSTVMYLMWTKHDDSVVLLAGSPKHILGLKVVENGMHIADSSGAAEEISRLVGGLSEALSIDESPFLTGPHTGRFTYAPPSGFDLSAVRSTWGRRSRSMSGLNYPGIGPESAALKLGVFCFRELGGLTLTRLEVLFTVFSKVAAHGNSLEDDLKTQRDSWLGKDFIQRSPELLALHQASWDQLVDAAVVWGFGRFKNIYTGSPLYTALESG